MKEQGDFSLESPPYTDLCAFLASVSMNSFAAEALCQLGSGSRRGGGMDCALVPRINSAVHGATLLSPHLADPYLSLTEEDITLPGIAGNIPVQHILFPPKVRD